MWEVRNQAVLSDPRLCIWRKDLQEEESKARSLSPLRHSQMNIAYFIQYADAQSMFIAIKARFGGKDAD
ncbi:hypothetical protein Tco_0615356 [Tanacetum coccineum]